MSTIEYDHLCKTLGGTHDADRPHGLVCGTKNESLHLMPRRSCNNIARADHIVRDRLFCIRFHQRNMLVRGGMKDNLRLMQPEHLLDAVFITHICNDRLNGELGKILREFEK